LEVIFVKWIKINDSLAMPTTLAHTEWTALVFGVGRIIRLGFEDGVSEKGWKSAFEHLHQKIYSAAEIADKEELTRVSKIIFYSRSNQSRKLNLLSLILNDSMPLSGKQSFPA